jgi:Ca2+-binding EF-hand superfamily protein
MVVCLLKTRLRSLRARFGVVGEFIHIIIVILILCFTKAAESGGNQPLLSPKGKRNFACDNKSTLNPIGMFAESDADADTFHTLKVRGRKNSLEQPWNRQNINASNDSPMVDVVGGGAANKLKAEKRAKDLSASMRAVNDGDTDSANWSESKSPVKWSGSAKQSSQRGSGTAAPVAGGVKTHSVRSPEDSKLLEQISDMIMSRSGKAGIESLGRFFIRSDRNKDGLLGRVELQDTMAVFGIRLTLQEVDRILACIDRDGSGQVTYSELLRELRGVLNPRRLDLVKLAFTRFDKSGDGQVDFQDLVNVFDASKHPDVKSGKISEKAAFDQFLANFELYGDKDGVITLDEFVEYYRWVSSNIDKDDYFELMIRNAWHIPGGKGQFENTANLRVLVTFIDGTQQVIGIDDDLGMGSNPSQSVLKARLRKQGVVNIQKVTIHD